MKRVFESERFLAYLSHQPELSDVINHIIHDFSSHYDIAFIRIGWIGINHQMEIIAESGCGQGADDSEPSRIGQIYPESTWKHSQEEEVRILIGDRISPWTSDGRVYVRRLLIADCLAGALQVGFAEPFTDEHEDFITTMSFIFQILTLYIIGNRTAAAAVALSVAFTEHAIAEAHALDMKITNLTPRQISILRLVSESKTNLQIGLQLGFSSSTVAGDLTEIFSFLGVSDRRAAIIAMRFHLDQEFIEE